MYTTLCSEKENSGTVNTCVVWQVGVDRCRQFGIKRLDRGGHKLLQCLFLGLTTSHIKTEQNNNNILFSSHIFFSLSPLIHRLSKSLLFSVQAIGQWHLGLVRNEDSLLPSQIYWMKTWTNSRWCVHTHHCILVQKLLVFSHLPSSHMGMYVVRTHIHCQQKKWKHLQ